jgi:exodeoxyribonuclease VII small subunit
LEKETMGLEESITLFEKGVALSESAKKRLDEAETRVEILSKRGSKIEPEPFGR